MADSHLAEEIRVRRNALLKQEDLADVSERFVYSLENGKQTEQLDKVLAVLNALGLHLKIHRGADREIQRRYPTTVSTRRCGRSGGPMFTSTGCKPRR